MPTLARWYLYDTSAKNPNILATSLGLTGVSEEGEQTEIHASKTRSKKVEPYAEFLRSMSTINAMALTSAYKLNNPDVEEDELEAMQELFAMSAYLGAYASFSAAFELGLIENPGMIGIDNE